MRAGLDASTVTPGRIPPDSSFTCPVIWLCAAASPGNSRIKRTMRTPKRNLRSILTPLCESARSKQPTTNARPLKLQSQLHLHRSHCLRTGRRPESSILRREPGRADRAVRIELAVLHGLIDRVAHLQRGLPQTDDGRVEEIEDVGAELDHSIAAKTDVSCDREVECVIETSAHQVRA